jgi:hypothetical protein
MIKKRKKLGEKFRKSDVYKKEENYRFLKSGISSIKLKMNLFNTT